MLANSWTQKIWILQNRNILNGFEKAKRKTCMPCLILLTLWDRDNIIKRNKQTSHTKWNTLKYIPKRALHLLLQMDHPEWFVKGGRGEWRGDARGQTLESKCCKNRVSEISMEVMKVERPSALLYKWNVDQFTKADAICIVLDSNSLCKNWIALKHLNI